ncbi:MAG: molybdate ABC transporter permease subunit [Sulfuricurvum sp. PD_MW2]|jgi:molybdate transport system permease protein|uniref:molybdate ABC transporter permease subunit n=1 Tax=Sulfuricurvum sp. PD_MW2 TaxID=2027917 RepID=UPI000C05DAF0|nr:molybdate ABC transporter permease subunit [Sulfuricurvum sp. PD_MW2]PHM18002.1 MAG: molybdate ABC transporter permease subunit [Sulfuricurvum sp. PD_MW2]
MESEFLSTMVLTFKLAAITTAILLVIAIPLASFLVFSKIRFKSILETIVSMPLVLPPSVLGFYLLLAFSPVSSIGSFLVDHGIRLAFSFEGLVISSVLFSLPFMVHPIQSALAQVPLSIFEASYTLGKSKLQTMLRVILPSIRHGLISGIVLAFAHTVGEFGVILMIGGNIPDETRVASIAIYDEVESLNYAMAHQYALTLFVVTFAILLLVYTLNKKSLGGIR